MAVSLKEIYRTMGEEVDFDIIKQYRSEFYLNKKAIFITKNLLI